MNVADRRARQACTAREDPMRSADQRRSIRLMVSPERDSAVLRIGRRSISGTIVNESSGGFAVRVDQDSPIAPGQVLLLGVDSGWSRVRVTYARRDEDGTVLGLERLADLPPEWAGSSTGGLWMFDRVRMRRPGGDWSWYLGGAMVVFGVILAATIWQVMSTNAAPRLVLAANDHARLRRAAHVGGQTSTSRRGADSPTSAVAGTRGESAARRAGASQAALERWLARRAGNAGKWLGGMRSTVARALPSLPSSASQTTQTVENLTRQAQRSWSELQDQVVLLLPQVADKLELTPAQRSRIETIVHDSRDTVQQVYRQAEDKSSPEVWQEIERVRKEAGEEALAQLTTQQQQLLVALRTH